MLKDCSRNLPGGYSCFGRPISFDSENTPRSSRVTRRSPSTPFRIDSRGVDFAVALSMAEFQNRTLICSVLFIDIVDYSRKAVVEQIELKDRFNALISEALRGVAVNDRIILDTVACAAISFIGDPEDAPLALPQIALQRSPRGCSARGLLGRGDRIRCACLARPGRYDGGVRNSPCTVGR